MRNVLPMLVLVACETTPPPAPPAPPPVAVPVPKGQIQASASSFLSDDSGEYTAQHAVDDNKATAWCEGAEGLGVGEQLTLVLGKPYDLDSIDIDGGFFKDDRTLTNNGRPRKLTVQSDAGWTVDVAFPFVPLREYRAETMKVKPVTVKAGGKASKLVFTLVEADEGRFTKDTCISEIVLRQKP